MEGSITKELCNHFYLGQWELMLGFFQSFKAFGTCDETVTKALKIVAHTPSNASVDHQPWLLAWQSCNLMEQLTKCEQDSQLSQNVEFNILLNNVLNREFACCAISQNLQECFGRLVKKEQGAHLPEHCVKLLEETFERRIFPVHCLLSKLLAHCKDGSHGAQLVLQLHQIYVSVLQSFLFLFKSSVLRSKVFDKEQLKEIKHQLLTLLSLLPDSLILNDSSFQVLHKCLKELLNFSYDGCLGIGEIYGSLLGREGPLLLQTFQKMEDTLMHRNAQPEQSLSLPQYISDVSCEGELVFQEIFLRMYNRKEHFIQEILNSSVEGILSSRWEQTLQQLSKGWLKVLLPLTACLAWKTCNTNLEAEHILKSIQALTLPEEPLQKLFVHLLKENVFITEWIANLWRQKSVSMGEAELLGRKRNMFSSLQKQSPLSAIHRSVGLRNICPQDVLLMLARVVDNRASVLSSDAGKLGDQTSVYRAYVTISSVMDAILSASKLESLKNANPVENVKGIPECQELKNGDCIISFYETHGFSPAYDRFVTTKLKTATEHFAGIYPATYQTEILENVFSLLFVTHNDILDTAVMPNESDEGHEGIDMNTPNPSPTKHMRDLSGPQVFSLSTVSLKEESSQRALDPFPSCSSPSTTSNSGGSITRLGFLCTQSVLRDILDLLKLSIDQILISRNTGSSEMVRGQPLTSVSVECQSDRLMQLSKYVVQALWRLEICSSDYSTECSSCRVPTSPVTQSRKLSLSTPSSNNSDNVSPTYVISTPNIYRTQKEAFRREISRRRKKRRQHRISILEDKSWQNTNDDSIMTRMLASPAALLCYSILRRNYKLAKEVSKMYSLKGTSDGQEAKFSISLQQLLQKLNTLPDNASAIKCKESTGATGRKLSDLAMAAAQGLETTSRLQIVDVFLGKCTFPTIPEVEMLREEVNIHSIPNIRNLLLAEAEQQQAIVLADIAYTSCFYLDKTQSLLSMISYNKEANERQPTGAKSKVREDQVHPLGIMETVEHMSAFFSEMASIVESGYGSEGVCPFYKLSGSPGQMIVQSLGPLRAGFLKRYLECWKMFMYQKKLVWKMISEEEQAQVVILDTNRNNANILNAAFTRFAKLCSSEICFFEGAWKTGWYLNAVNKRLKHVSLVLEKYAANKGLGWMMQRSHLAVLKHNLDELLGQLILKDIVSLDKLEELAREIQMNLVHVIARTCYPPLPNTRAKSQLSNINRKELVLTDDDSPKVLSHSVSSRNPELVTRELLLELLQLLKDVCSTRSNCVVTISDAVQLVQDSSFGLWLDLVPQELLTLDLTQMTSSEQRLALYVNLVNLTYLHALFKEISRKAMTLKTMNQEGLPLISSCLSKRLYALWSTSYTIGQLQDVSLFDLYHWFALSQDKLPGLYMVGSPFSKAFDKGNLERLKTYFPYLDPRVLFALVQGFISSPRLQVFTPDSVIIDLNLAMEDYLNFFTEANVLSKTVHLPELLYWFQSSFLQEERENYEGLLSFVSLNLKGDLKDSFKKLQTMEFHCDDADEETCSDSLEKRNLPFNIELSPFITQFGITLAYSDSKGPPKVSKTQPRTVHQDLPFHARQYICKQCPLVANLLHLLHSDLSDSEEPLQRQINLHQTRWQQLNSTDHFDWLPTALCPQVYPEFLWKQIQLCFDKGEYSLVFEYLVESKHLNLPEELREMQELTLRFLAAKNICQFSDLMPWSFSLRLGDDAQRYQAVLNSMDTWPTSVALETLGACLGSTRSTSELFLLMQEKMVQTTMRHKILRVINKHCLDGQKPLSLWAEGELLLSSNPSKFLPCLYSEPELLLQWTEAGCIPKALSTEYVQEIWKQVLFWLLQQTPLDMERVSIALDALPHRDLEVIFSLVNGCSYTTGQLFLVNYALDHLHLDQTQITSIKNLRIGIQMVALMAEPEDYNNLIHFPLLLLEQLIMRLEIETLSDVLKVIRRESDFPLQETNSLLEKYSGKAMEFSIVDTPADESVDSVPVSSGAQFVMPIPAPKKDDWAPDSTSSTCMICLQTFGMFCRRHHCRRCGRLVCASCSQHTLVVDGYSNIPVRSCSDCFEQTNANNGQNAEYGSLTFNSLASTPQTPGSRVSFGRERQTSSLVSIFSPLPTFLTSDLKQNQVIREEFCFEQAPSVNLCLSLLQLHSDSLQCARSMLAQCDLLFNLLSPTDKGRSKPQVDYALLISMMRTLVLSAKVKFLEVSTADEEAVLCDTYLRSLDLVNMLVRNNCTHLIPASRGPFLNSPEAVRRLLEQLLEEERMVLSLEVATKCSLDLSFLWATWGKVCLKAGHWTAAREKFSKCFQKPQDMGKSHQENPLVKQIVSILENSRGVNGQVGAILESLKSLKSLQAGEKQFIPSEGDNFAMLNECQYYLRQYGSPLSLMAFLLRHDLIAQAVMYLSEKSWDTDLFLQGLLLPSLKIGRLDVVLQHVRSQDPTLVHWWLPLVAACQHMQKSGLYRLLHTLQNFMGDYVRAGMTCIHFYQRPCRDYKDLAGRLQHLVGARRSFETYLRNSQLDGAEIQKRVLQIPVKAVQGYIETVHLQTEVTSYLSLCQEEEENLPHLSEVEKTLKVLRGSQSMEAAEEGPETQERPNCPPTLFDSSSRKRALACFVLYCSLKNKQGVGLGVRIIKGHGLDLNLVCSGVGQLLIDQGRVKEIPTFLSSIRESSLGKNLDPDNVILNCIQLMSEVLSQTYADVTPLIELLVNKVNKVNAYITCRKLKSAYTAAIRLERADLVRRIQEVARQSGQDSVANFCERWLKMKDAKGKT